MMERERHSRNNTTTTRLEGFGSGSQRHCLGSVPRAPLGSKVIKKDRSVTNQLRAFQPYLHDTFGDALHSHGKSIARRLLKWSESCDVTSEPHISIELRLCCTDL